ncbi:MAG: hypothetical protein PWP11_1264 [Thauera sp.]|jgi:O-antigen chain-terminating methyltransferase|nr:methyltransferase domain-containing protein [Thauera sp.]MDI3489987.1 hypothetical protein [Thauera sp.]
MFLEQNPHIDYAALKAAVDAELQRPPGPMPPPAPLHTPLAETSPAPELSLSAMARGIGARLQRWPRVYGVARKAWHGIRATVVAIRKRPALYYCVRWARWLVSLPKLADLFAAQAVQVDQQRAILMRLEQTLNQQQTALQSEIERVEHRLNKHVRSTTAEHARIEGQTVLLRESLEDLQHAWQRFKTEVAQANAAGGQLVANRPLDAAAGAPLSAVMDRFYQEFEDAWRGPQAVIRERVAHYLPKVTAAGAGTPNAPLADLGCGRGEWLAVLDDAGLTAFGVDSNATAIARTRAQGLTAFEADVGEWMAQRGDESLGAISALHVVEHLPFEVLVRTLDEALRVLRPGGLLILETPDPANIMVATGSFWLDPSHLRPIPADLLAFTVRSRGFEAVEVERLHPVDESLRFTAGHEVGDRLNTLLYGPQDYAVIARKPQQ